MDYRNSKDFKVYTERKPKLFNPKTRKWSDVGLKGDKGSEYFELTLPAGGGALLRF